MVFEPGAVVRVKQFGGGSLKRIVIADHGNTVMLCNPDEFKDAAKNKRDPVGIGFPRCDVKSYPH
jgi:hypothetical protein